MIKIKLEKGEEEENMALDPFEASSFIFTVILWFAHLYYPYHVFHVYSSTLKLEARNSSEMFVSFHQTTQVTSQETLFFSSHLA
jgi:hypothetical protein